MPREREEEEDARKESLVTMSKSSAKESGRKAHGDPGSREVTLQRQAD